MDNSGDLGTDEVSSEDRHRVFWSDHASYFLDNLPEKQRQRIEHKVRRNLSSWPEACPLMPQTHPRYEDTRHLLVSGPPDFQVVFRVERNARKVFVVLIYYARGKGPQMPCRQPGMTPRESKRAVQINDEIGRRATLIIFAGRKVSSPIERTLALAERAIARDTIERAVSTGYVERVVVATDSVEFAESLSSLAVIAEVDEGEFHFGSRLREIIRRYDIARPFYLGAGSAPLLSVERIASICETLVASESVVLANNFYSSDFVAFTPGAALDRIDPPDVDNNLAFLLNHHAGLPNVPVPREAGTQMDIDTPTDLTILALHPGVGRHTRALLDDGAFVTESGSCVKTLNRLLQVIVDPAREVLIAGRVGAQAWSLVERGFACRTRVVSEERGMRASGRDARGEVRSVLGHYLQAVGIKRFFGVLGELTDGAIVDSRVLFEHFGLKPTPSDRFYSDLLAPEKISDPLVRDLTEAAASAPIPVILGGHSLVSGDLWALVEVASHLGGDGAGSRWNAHPKGL